jgi:hypothetical protein
MVGMETDDEQHNKPSASAGVLLLGIFAHVQRVSSPRPTQWLPDEEVTVNENTDIFVFDRLGGVEGPPFPCCSRREGSTLD